MTNSSPPITKYAPAYLHRLEPWSTSRPRRLFSWGGLLFKLLLLFFGPLLPGFPISFFKAIGVTHGKLQQGSTPVFPSIILDFIENLLALCVFQGKRTVAVGFYSITITCGGIGTYSGLLYLWSFPSGYCLLLSHGAQEHVKDNPYVI
jgi:hypothetical protein